MTAIIDIDCNEHGQLVNHKVELLILTRENLLKLWQKCKHLRTIFGQEFVSVDEFQQVLMTITDNSITPHGIFWVVDDFRGIFYVTDIRIGYDALVHYIFFDRKHDGREPLVKAMLKHVFSTYSFNRLSAEIPMYASKRVHAFALRCGFSYEGRRREATKLNDTWFDSKIYGILQREALNGSK